MDALCKPGSQRSGGTAGSGRHPRAHGRMTDGDSSRAPPPGPAATLGAPEHVVPLLFTSRSQRSDLSATGLVWPGS
jgi:hypothetical protein